MSVVSFNSPWLTSLLSRILNARLKHLRIGFCNIYNARIIGPLLNVTEVITVRCFLCIDFSGNDTSVFQCWLLVRVHMSRSNIIYFISNQKITFQNHHKKHLVYIFIVISKNLNDFISKVNLFTLFSHYFWYSGIKPCNCVYNHKFF